MEDKKTILIVDDSDINRSLLKSIFSNEYNIIEAKNGKECIDILNILSQCISVILLDIYMPKMGGLEVLKYMKKEKLTYNIPVVIITGDNDSIELQAQAFELGASDFMFKPFIREIIKRRVKNLIDLYSYKVNIEHTLKEKSVELEESKKEVEETNEFLIDALSTVVEFRNLESGEHVKRVKTFTNILATYVMNEYPEYRLDEEEVKLITSASALHDIGKIGISDAILLKPGRLTTEEFAEMKNHTIYGADLLNKFKRNGKSNEFFDIAYNIARYHHERYDGNGYPDKLVGDDIPICAQIVALADVYDALVSKRVYKDAFDIDDAYKMIIDGKCGVFSNKMINVFKHAKQDMVNATIEKSTL